MGQSYPSGGIASAGDESSWTRVTLRRATAHTDPGEADR